MVKSPRTLAYVLMKVNANDIAVPATPYATAAAAWSCPACSARARTPVVKGITATVIRRKPFRKSSERSNVLMAAMVAWWLTQMTRIVTKLIT